MSTYLETSQQASAAGKDSRDTRTVSRLLTLVGSGYQSLAEYSSFIAESIVVVADVPAELACLRIHPALRNSVHLFPTGRNSTIRSLAQEYGSREQLQALEAFPNMSLDDGIGQVRGFGAMAIRELIARADFQSFLQQLPGMLLSAAGGEMPLIQHDARHGTSGGQAGEGALLLWKEFVSVLLAATDATIDSSVHLIGGISYTGPGFPKTQANAAASIVEWLHCSNHLPSNRVNLSLYCSELPPVGTNKPLRTQCLLDHCNSLRAPAVVENVQRMRSNRTTSGEYGNVTLTRSDQFRGINKREIVGEVAAAYLPRFESLLREPANPGQLNELHFKYQYANENRPTVKQVLSRAMRTGDVEQLVGLTLSSRGTRVRPLLSLYEGGTIDLQRVRDHFAASLSTPKEVRRRISIFRAAIDLLVGEISELRKQFDPIERRLEERIKRIESNFARLLRRQTKKRTARLLQELLDARQIHETLEEMHCEQSALRHAEDELRSELSQLISRIDRLRQGVKRCELQSPDRKGPPRIAPVSLTRSLAELLAVSDTMGDDLDALHHTLSKMTEFVTLDGLTQITGSQSVTIESVVSEVISRQIAQ